MVNYRLISLALTPFTVLLDDVAGGADNVVVVRRRA